MAKPNRMNGGAVAGVRLTDVPLKVRERYGRMLLERAIKELEPFPLIEFAAALSRAVEEPSDRVYWVSRDAAERVLR